jgi:iron complex transport system substrate-binding protein
MRYFWIIIAFFLASQSLASQDNTIPSEKENPKSGNINRVFGSAPPMTIMIHVMDDTKLFAVNSPIKNNWNNAEERFLTPHLLNLPMLGGWHGDRQANLEEILLAHPDLIVLWDTPLLSALAIPQLEKINIPFIKVSIERTDLFPQAFRTVGEALGKRERGEALATYAEEEIRQLQDFIASIPSDKRVRVYYAEDQEGLRTDCDYSFHAEPIGFAGGLNVQQCSQSTVMGMVSINFEQILRYNPDVIVAQEEEFLRKITQDDKWQNLTAVKKKKVYLVPRTPFNWLDRPPSFMRILGTHWLTSKFYPESYPYDLRSKAKSFFDLFFGVTLSDNEMATLFPSL